MPKFCIGGKTVIDEDNKRYNLTNQLQVSFVNKSQKITAEFINTCQWQNLHKKALLFGNKTEAYLLKCNLKNISKLEQFVISVEQPNIDHFEIFDSNYKSLKKTGDIYSWDTREFKESYPSFSLHLTKNSSQTYYFLVHMAEDGVAPITLYHPYEYFNFFSQREWIFGIFLGLMGVIAIYNLFLYFSVNEKLYLFYSIYVTTLCFAHSSLLGGLNHHLYLSNLFLSRFDAVLFPAIMAPSAYLFIEEYFRFSKKQYSFIILKVLVFSILISALCLITKLIDFNTAFIIMNICFVGCYLTIIYIGKINIEVNGFLSRIFLLAWSLMLIGGIFYVFITSGLLEYNQDILYLMPIGAALETIILSLALGYRIRILKKEKIQASELLETETKNTKQLQSDLKDIELQAIRGQINPHFIFNALNSIQFLIHKLDNDNASKYLTIFSRLIRKSLQFTEMKRITIQEEISFIEDYIKIEQLRFSDPFNFSIEFGDSPLLQDATVPPLITQPFIENAIKHAFSSDTKKGELILRINLDENEELMLVEIQDNGQGIQEKTGSKHSSKGISISQKRLALLNSEIKKDLLSLTISNISSSKNKAKGVLVKFSLPLH